MPGTLATRGFKYKLGKFGSGVKTADNFVTVIGSRSEKSGHPYYVLYDKKKVPSRVVLSNELRRLEEYEDSLNKTEYDHSLPAPDVLK